MLRQHIKRVERKPGPKGPRCSAACGALLFLSVPCEVQGAPEQRWQNAEGHVHHGLAAQRGRGVAVLALGPPQSRRSRDHSPSPSLRQARDTAAMFGVELPSSPGDTSNRRPSVSLPPAQQGFACRHLVRMVGASAWAQRVVEMAVAANGLRLLQAVSLKPSHASKRVTGPREQNCAAGGKETSRKVSSGGTATQSHIEVGLWGRNGGRNLLGSLPQARGETCLRSLRPAKKALSGSATTQPMQAACSHLVLGGFGDAFLPRSNATGDSRSRAFAAQVRLESVRFCKRREMEADPIRRRSRASVRDRDPPSDSDDDPPQNIIDQPPESSALLPVRVGVQLPQPALGCMVSDSEMC